MFGSTPVLQSPFTKSISNLNFSAISYQRVEKCPVSNIKILSPALNVFTIAASHAPVPEAGNIITGSEVLNINLIRSNTLNPNSAKSGPL